MNQVLFYLVFELLHAYQITNQSKAYISHIYSISIFFKKKKSIYLAVCLSMESLQKVTGVVPDNTPQ